MKNVLRILIAFIPLLFIGCSSVKVINIKDCKKDIDNYLIYYLPKTVIKVEIDATQKIIKKGIYSDYAEKYLGIKDVTDDDKIEWYLTDININTLSEADSNQVYLLKARNKSIANNINLSNDGVLLSINQANNEINTINDETDKNISYVNNNEIAFTNLSVNKYFANVSDTSYKVVKRDSVFIKVPVLSNKVIGKTFENKAEEIANTILDLREERISLISGDYNTFPDGNAMKQLIEESYKLEAEYLSLFIGKTYEVKNKYTFYFIPDSCNIKKINTLCFFSKNNGIVSNNLSGCYPIIIQISEQGITNSIENFKIKPGKKKKNNNGIYYRIPDIAIVNIYDDNQIIASKKILISQLGTINLLPGKLLKNKKKTIQFYPASGALKSINILK